MEFKRHFYGDPILRKQCVEVEGEMPELYDLLEQWPKLAPEWNAAGMAGPQIGIPKRFFILCLYETQPDGSMVLGPPNIYINPKLSDPSKETDIIDEGCVSLPGIRVPVERPLEITAEWTDLDGKQHKQRFVGYQARQMMHENDHLNGVLTIDRMPRNLRNKVEPHLRQIKKQYYKAA